MPWAVGGTLVRHPKKVTLFVAPEMLKRDEPYFRDILRHEAIHLGFPRHDRGFRELAQEKGIPFTDRMAHGSKFSVQTKQGTRYQTVKEFDTHEAAMAYGKALAKANRDLKIRLKF
jgi:hypothetical protein